MTTATDSTLFRFALRVSREPFFLAYHLARLRREYRQTVEQQASAVGLDLDGWTFLALCGMPATGADVERIAERLGMDAPRLGELLQLDLWE